MSEPQSKPERLRRIGPEELMILSLVHPGLAINPSNPTVDVNDLEAIALDALRTEVNYPEIPAIYAWLLLADPPPAETLTLAAADTLAELTRAYLRSLRSPGQPLRVIKLSVAREMGRIISRVQNYSFRTQTIVQCLKSQWRVLPMDAADVASPVGPFDFFGRMVGFWALRFRPDRLFDEVLRTNLDHSHVGIRAMTVMAILALENPDSDTAMADKLRDKAWLAEVLDPRYPSVAPETDFVFFLERGLESRTEPNANLLRALAATDHDGLAKLAERFAR
ncbi:MAG TPA: hypothetical protein VN673_07465 [Clostridia bacterium]|nr:hypothetical protein [Clostridia bacterium]